MTDSPSQEALEAAQDNVRCTRDGPCLNYLCGQCIRTAMLLDRFRAAGVVMERERIAALIRGLESHVLWEGKAT